MGRQERGRASGIISYYVVTQAIVDLCFVFCLSCVVGDARIPVA